MKIYSNRTAGIINTLTHILLTIMFASINISYAAGTEEQQKDLSNNKIIAKLIKRPDYSKQEGWALQEISLREKKPADVFYIPSTTDLKGQNGYNLDLSNPERIKYYSYTVTKEISIYKKSCAVFSPYYRQVTFPTYQLPEKAREKHLKLAYKDIKRAFSYYLKNRPQSRPFILAGYSQGADMV